jgi:hypothetical protein
VKDDFRLIPLVAACEQMKLSPEELVAAWWAEPLARQFPDRRRELAVRLPSWLLNEGTTAKMRESG